MWAAKSNEQVCDTDLRSSKQHYKQIYFVTAATSNSILRKWQQKQNRLKM